MRVTKNSHRVAGNVRAEMARHGTNQTKLAPLISFSQQALSRRLNGEVAFNIDELSRIAEVLQVSITVLIDGDRASA